MKGLLLPIAAPSGTGKTTVCHNLMQGDERFLFSVSCTTRPPRPNERDGVDYYFITRQQFEEFISTDKFVEWEEVFGNYYGTLKSAVSEALEKHKILLLDIDVKGALNIKKLYPQQTISIFLLPPSFDELERRLNKRGTDDDQSLAIRKARLATEVAYSKQFDRVIVNDHLDDTVNQIKKIIEEYNKYD